MTNINNAKKLIKDIHVKIRNWNERSQFILKGVKNLSKSDLDTLELYAETYINNNGSGFSGLMKPLGAIKQVLDKYQLIETLPANLWNF